MRIGIVRALGQLKAVARLAMVVACRHPQGLRSSSRRTEPEKGPMTVLRYLRATESYTFALHGKLSAIQAFAMH